MSKQSLTKTFKLLEVIRKNTDKDHPATQQALRDEAGETLSREAMGDKGTYARRLAELAEAYNTDENGELLPENQWKIVYPGFRRPENSGQKNGKVYYAHPVSGEEMDFLISCVRRTHDFTSEEKVSLEKRLKEALSSKYYEYSEQEPQGLVREYKNRSFLSQENVDRLERNISELRQYIRKRKMVEISGEGIETCDVSPYRIVLQDGFYWLIANWHERPAETFDHEPTREYCRYDRFFPWYTDVLTAYRIDLIHGIRPAVTPDKTFVHWSMSVNLSNSYTRENAGRERKARYNENMQKLLELFDQRAAELIFENSRDIDL